uniref:uncharacterized protein LOC110598687 isoform X2 n=1 Tax=Ictidomys tridecemlineatus TaxID=43179 RepID=UPI001A9D43FA|nr:uncharacterized protein LOC110598687 isoform X2 [Ictidomys tridecemlineatus]
MAAHQRLLEVDSLLCAWPCRVSLMSPYLGKPWDGQCQTWKAKSGVLGLHLGGPGLEGSRCDQNIPEGPGHTARERTQRAGLVGRCWPLLCAWSSILQWISKAVGATRMVTLHQSFLGRHIECSAWPRGIVGHSPPTCCSRIQPGCCALGHERQGHSKVPLCLEPEAFQSCAGLAGAGTGALEGSAELFACILPRSPAAPWEVFNRAGFPCARLSLASVSLCVFQKMLSILHFLNPLIICLTVCLGRGKPKLRRISPTSLQVSSVNTHHSPAGWPNLPPNTGEALRKRWLVWALLWELTLHRALSTGGTEGNCKDGGGTRFVFRP